MKKIKNIQILGWAFLMALLYLSSCQEKFPQDFTPYRPTPVTADNLGLKYAPKEAYPAKTVIKSDTPTFTISGVYSFSIDTVIASENGSYVQSNFSIDRESGVISYDNTSGSIKAGNYGVSVVVSNPTGQAVVDTAFHLTILNVPVKITVDNPVVNANALQEGVIATVGYQDLSPDHSITSVSYALANAVTGYSIDANTGAISKSSSAAADTTVKLSVTLTTNLGTATFSNVVTVNVGPPPTLKYVQQDGSTTLTKVILSPWTGYTTHAPVLTGMESSGGWKLLLPDTINAGAFSIGADGAITVLPNMNLPLGDFTVGVEVTNGSGISFDFPDQFTIHVETRWDPSPVFFEDFNNATTTAVPVHDYNPALSSYAQHGTSTTFQVVNVSGNGRNFYAARVFKGKSPDKIETDMILSLKIDPSWHDLRVSFTEMFGYADKALDTWQRTLSYSYDTTDVASGNYDPANWHTLMSATDPDWPGSSGWKTGKTDNDFTPVPAKDFGGIDNTKSHIFINWWYANLSGTDTKGAQFLVDNLKVEVSKAFAAEEQ